MITYKLFRMKNNKLYPLYVEADKEMKLGEYLKASVGEKVDDTHVKAKGCGGKLSLRPGYHSTLIPFTDWIGKKTDHGLVQRKNTVWCECDVPGNEIKVVNKNGLQTLPNGWYRFKTNSRQKDPWIISNKIKINRILSNDEVKEICKANGVKAQEVEV